MPERPTAGPRVGFFDSGSNALAFESGQEAGSALGKKTDCPCTLKSAIAF